MDDRQTDREMDQRMDGWTDGQTAMYRDVQHIGNFDINQFSIFLTNLIDNFA